MRDNDGDDDWPFRILPDQDSQQRRENFYDEVSSEPIIFANYLLRKFCATCQLLGDSEESIF